MTISVSNIEQPPLKFYAQRYQQGGREAYSLTLDLGTLDGLLPEDVDPDQIKDANRRFNKAHSKRIEDYLYDTNEWVLSAILLGINPAYCQFVPYTRDDGQPSETMGELHIPLVGGRSSMKILDGQHRRKAIHQVRERLEQEILDERNSLTDNSKSRSSRKRLKSLETQLGNLNGMAIPVMIYRESDTKKLRRMFADLAKTRNIDEITKARFDDRNPFNRAAQSLAELGNSDLLRGRVEMERSTPPRDSNNLLSLNQLSRCLVTLKFGHGARLSRERLREVEQNYNALVDIGIAWADDFLPSAREEYEILCSDELELEKDYIAMHRSKFLAYTVPVLQILAGCLYEWNKLQRPREELQNWLRDADFNSNSKDCIFLKTGALIYGESSLLGRMTSTKSTISYIVERALLANS